MVLLIAGFLKSNPFVYMDANDTFKRNVEKEE
jgi:hypothetical protein